MNTPANPKRSPDIEDALKAIYQSPAPPDAFVHQLEQQLLARQAGESVHPSPAKPTQSTWRFNMFWQRSRQLLGSLAALATLAVLIVALIALFSNAKQLATNKSTPTPTGPLLQLNGSITQSMDPVNTNQIAVSVRAPLPQLPNPVPLYNIKAEAIKPSVETVRIWAAKLGLGTVRVYTENDDVSNKMYFAQADDGRTVQLMPNGEVMYQIDTNTILSPAKNQPALDLDKAKTIAEAFLNRIPDLFVLEGNSSAKITLQVKASPNQIGAPSTPLPTFQYTPLIDGIPASNTDNGGYIVIGADGQVAMATLTPLRITPTGQEATLQPIETVVRAFLKGDQNALRVSSSGMKSQASSTSAPQVYYREPNYPIGEVITLTGYVQHWIAADGGADQYLLMSPEPQTFILTGQGLNAASRTEVTGRITGQVRPGLWGIEVTAMQSLESGKNSSNPWTGVIHRQDAGVWLETDSGQKYLLPDPPADLADGQRVLAWGIIKSGTPSSLEWHTLSALPKSPAGEASSGGVSLSPSGSVVIEQGQGQIPAPDIAPLSTIISETTITQPTAAPQSMEVPATAVGGFQTVAGGSASGRAIFTPTLPAWWTYKSGDEVTLEGVLSAQGYRIQANPAQPDQSATPIPDRLVFQASLVATPAEDKPDETVPLTLVGDQVNVDLLQLDGLHARVQGRLLSWDEARQRYPGLSEKGFSDFALEVTHYEKALPGEIKAVFSGQIRMDTLAGKEVAIFSDTLSNQEYVLADPLEMYQQLITNKDTLTAIGIFESGPTFAGRPLLRLRAISSSSPGGQAAPIQTMRDQLANPVQDLGPESLQPTDITIDQIELAYVFQTLPALDNAAGDLVYRLTGHSSDGRYTATYDLAAVAPTEEPPSSDSQPARQHPLNVKVGDFATLLGFDQTADSATPGGTLGITLHWQVNAKTTTNYTVFLHVLNAKGDVVAQIDAPPVNGTRPTTSWQPGEAITDQYILMLPNDLPAGEYQLVMGLYDAGGGARLKTDQGNDVIPLTTIVVESPTIVVETPSSNSQPAMRHPLNVKVGDFATLLGFDQSADSATPGGTISVTLYWQVNIKTTTNYNVFLHVLNAKGDLVAQIDAPPVNSAPRTTSRQPGEAIEDRYTDQYSLTLPNDLPAGQYQLVVGLYDTASGERLKTGQKNDSIPLTTITAIAVK